MMLFQIFNGNKIRHGTIREPLRPLNPLCKGVTLLGPVLRLCSSFDRVGPLGSELKILASTIGTVGHLVACSVSSGRLLVLYGPIHHFRYYWKDSFGVHLSYTARTQTLEIHASYVGEIYNLFGWEYSFSHNPWVELIQLTGLFVFFGIALPTTLYITFRYNFGRRLKEWWYKGKVK